MDNQQIEFLKRLAHGIALQFGSSCEVVVHDLRSDNPARTIVAIENGHITGRKIGDGPSNVVLKALHSDSGKLHDSYSYLTKTEDGKILKSTTIYLRDDDNKPIAIFAINYDIALFVINVLKQHSSRVTFLLVTLILIHFVKRQNKTLCFYAYFDDSTIMKTEWYVAINYFFYIHDHLRISINIS